jgi:hypothetical protein
MRAQLLNAVIQASARGDPSDDATFAIPGNLDPESRNDDIEKSPSAPFPMFALTSQKMRRRIEGFPAAEAVRPEPGGDGSGG